MAQFFSSFQGQGSPSDLLQGFLAFCQGSGKTLGPWGQDCDPVGCAWAVPRSLRVSCRDAPEHLKLFSRKKAVE